MVTLKLTIEVCDVCDFVVESLDNGVVTTGETFSPFPGLLRINHRYPPVLVSLVMSPHFVTSTGGHLYEISPSYPQP